MRKNIVEKIKTRNLVSITFLKKSFPLLDTVVKYCRAWQATDDNMEHALACWLTKATNAHSEYVMLVFPL